MSIERVLVTGAAGFIGGRVVERLRSESGVEVRAGVRGWKGCARVARLGVPLVRCDLGDPDSLRVAIEGTETVIHCAMSDAASIVDGTRNVLEAATHAGVRKVVHLSTGDVYSELQGSVTENGAREMIGDWYSDAKRSAEECCAAFAAGGLGLTLLRPGIVYGPFCYAWTQRIGMRLAAGQVSLLPEAQNGVCNALFVDDLVEAITVLRHPGPGDGRAFNVNGPEMVRWNQYLTAFAQALGVPPPSPAAGNRTTWKSRLLQPARQTSRWLLKRYQKPIMQLYSRSRFANRIMKGMEATFRATPESRELAVYGRRIHLDDSRLRTEFGWAASTPMAEGLRIASQYLRVFGLVD